MPRAWTLCVLTGLALLVGACEAPRDGTPAPVEPPQVLSEYRPAAAATGDKRLGEACSAGGNGECASGLCLQAFPGRGTGEYCSQRCATREDCPDGWRCQSGTPGNGVCFPPPGWTGANAER